MYAFYIEGDEVKVFMNKLLREDIFDSYEMRSVELETIVKLDIDGKINKEYLNENEERQFCFWSEIRGQIFELIKGKKRPKVFKVVLGLTKERVEILHTNGAAMFLNISFENSKVNFITASSQKSFSLDKSVDHAWEDYIKKFFKKIGICAIDM